MHINGKKIKKLLVLGLGVSGIAALKLAYKKGLTAVGIDESDDIDLSLIPDSVKILTGFKLEELPSSDLIVISPGISDDSRLGKLSMESGVPVISELDFASRFAEVPILAITGTNGKTTVTEMTAMLLEGAVACGNIGYPLSAGVLDKSAKFLVVECSSFQLEKSPSFSPETAAILNISSDHLDRYARFEDYISAKFNIFNNFSSSSGMVINHNLLFEWNKRKGNYNLIKSEDKPLTFSATTENAEVRIKDGKVDFCKCEIDAIDLKKSSIKGKHNIENFMASVALATPFISKSKLNKAVRDLIREFALSEHRQEIVAEKDGITYVNDSKATNPDAVAAALELFSEGRNICLIAGGLDKKMDFSEIINYRDSIKGIFLFGESAEKLNSILTNDIDCIICNSFENAVLKSKDLASSGDVVLLSPGCASMDLFRNYKERGDFFRKIILQSLA